MVNLSNPGFTIGEIANDTDSTIPQCQYVAMKLKLKPAGRCGIIRLFDATQLEAIRQGLQEIRPYGVAV